MDFRHQLRVQNPSIFRISVPLTRWALDWSLQQKYLYDDGAQVGDPCVNGIPWPSQGAAQRQFQDGAVITVFLQSGSHMNEVCVDSSDSASDDYSDSEEAPVELQLVTLFQSGHAGDDQRFDILVPWHEPISASLQWCVANPLVGWAAPCRSYRRMPWQHQRQVFALAWTDLIEAHTVPVLFIETDVGSSARDCHVEYLPVQLRLEDLLFWAHRTGPFEVVDRWRHVHPTLPNVLTFGLGAQVWLRFSAPPPLQVAAGVVMLQTALHLQPSSTTRPYGNWLDPSFVIPAGTPDSVWSPTVVCVDAHFSATTSTTTEDGPSSLPFLSDGIVMANYSEDNPDLSSGSSYAIVTADSDREFAFLDPSLVLLCADSDGQGLTSATPIDLPEQPSSLQQSVRGSSGACYTEDNVDLSSGGSGCSLTGTNENGGIIQHSPLDPRLASLHEILDALASPWPEYSICHNYQVIPALHPVAAMICSDQDWTPLFGNEVRYHIYTDGSALSQRHSKAAWAFHIVLESMGPLGSHFHRIGFTGAMMDGRTPEAHPDSLDAEALALIFAADWLLSLPEAVSCVLHFDALAAGCGACGVQNEPSSAQHARPLQHLARVAISLAQARHDEVRWHHIKAHAGQPDNEAADSVAYAIVVGWTPPCHPPFRMRAFFEHPLRDWAWMEYRPTVELPNLTTILTARPQDPSGDDAMWTPTTTRTQAKVAHISWKLGTANVRTMDYHRSQYTDKLPLLRAQLQDQAFDVFAFQECRGRQNQCVDDGTFIRVCSAGHNGQGGVELWFLKTGAFAQTGFGPLSIDHLAVWHTSSTVLGVHCAHPALLCTFVAIYGPQSGRSPDEIHLWWKDLLDLLRHRPKGGPLVLLGDANAHVGSVVSEGIGDLAPEIEDHAGTSLRECCEEMGLVIPTTFHAFHKGESSTYIGPRDSATRVDYIALPLCWLPGVEFTALCPELDLMTNGPDHVAVQVVLTMCVQPHHTMPQGRTTQYDRTLAQSPEGQEKLTAIAQDLTPQPWTLDVNDHWNALRQEVLHTCARNFPKRKRHQRQHYMSTTLWHIVEDRKEVSSRLRGLQRTRSRRLLAGLFAIWRGDAATWHALYTEDVLADQVYAHDLHQFDSLSQRFLSVRKLERKAWYSQCAQHLQDGLSRSALSQWFKLLRPKRAIRHKTQPASRMPGVRTDDGEWLTRGRALSVMWQRHFGKIENAEDGCPQDILRRSTPSTSEITVDMLLAQPTLFDLERSMRGANPRKAAGPDQIGAEVWRANIRGNAKRCFALFLKSGLRHQWVAEFAGGDLIPLYKKGDAARPSNYRAILLEPTLGRIFSRAWRSRLVDALQMVQAPLQFGGHEQVSIEVAHLVVRNAQQISQARKRSCSMIFADLRSAFYTVAKPFLTGENTTPEAMTQLFNVMGLPQDALEAFVEAIENGVTIPPADASGHLGATVAAMLRPTWAKVPGSDSYMLPRTGSRPGDPLADTLFGFLMARALGAISERFENEELTTTWDGQRWIAPSVTWVDDAIFHVEASAAQLYSKTVCALRIIHEEMLRVGLQLNYGQGKTEVMACYWGRHSTQHAQHFYKKLGGSYCVWNEFDGVLAVRTVPHYKHLGGFITRNMSLHPELRIRKAQMHQQLHGLKRCALSDQALPLSQRRALLHSLGLSVLTLHSGTWRPLRKCVWAIWHGATTSAYQYLQQRKQDGTVSHKTTLELAVDADSPLPHALLYLRRLRVLTQVCRHGPGLVLDNLHCHHLHCGSRSWLSGAQEAVEWARANADSRDWISELDQLLDPAVWPTLHSRWGDLRRLFRKVERVHCYRNRMCLDLKQQKAQHDELLIQNGWTPPPMQDVPEPIDAEYVCASCGYVARSLTALGVHEHKKHGTKIVARRFAVGNKCEVCYKSFHTRPRLLLHLQYGTTRCLVHYLRHCSPMSADDADKLDKDDRTHGVALHQKGLTDAFSSLPCFAADVSAHCEDLEQVTSTELTRWSTLGSLPTWLTGQHGTRRAAMPIEMIDPIEELKALEQQWCNEASQWKAPVPTIPRALSECPLYFLVFFSGHRRYGDLVSWIEWTYEGVTPVPIDLAIDSFWGDARRGGLWADLIRSGRVAGAHFGPPCETYTDARWLEVIGEVEKRLPRPLRTLEYGWGVPGLSLKELKQLDTGSHLMWLSIGYMMLIDTFGGSASLEHPKGQAPAHRRFSVWISSLVQRLLQAPQWNLTTFLQGPLGVEYAKPTRLLHVRLPGMSRALYRGYDPTWRPTEVLGGKASDGTWATMKAKAYPVRMNEILARVHWDYIRRTERSGCSADPPLLRQALGALTAFWDPYLLTTKGATMTHDYHG